MTLARIRIDEVLGLFAGLALLVQAQAGGLLMDCPGKGTEVSCLSRPKAPGPRTIRQGNCTPALSSRAQRSGVEGSRDLATTPDVLGSSRDPSTPLRCARDDSAGGEVPV